MNANLALCHKVLIHPKHKSRNYPKPKLHKTTKPKTNPNPKTQDPNVLGEFWYRYIPNGIFIMSKDY